MHPRQRPKGDSNARDQRWFLRADHLVAFVRLHGRWPHRRSDDADEVSLAWFLHNNAHGVRGTGAMRNAMTPERVDYLDERLPGWSENRNVAPDGDWLKRAIAYALFRRVNELQPSMSSVDSSESDLAGWISRQRGLEPDSSRARLLDRLVPDWRAARPSGRPFLRARWYRAADAAVAYLRTGELDPALSETFLRGWIHRARGMPSYGQPHLDRAAYLDRSLPGWRVTALPVRRDRPARRPEAPPVDVILAARSVQVPPGVLLDAA